MLVVAYGGGRDKHRWMTSPEIDAAGIEAPVVLGSTTRTVLPLNQLVPGSNPGAGTKF